MSAPAITEKDIRLFVMDKPELNTLICGNKWSSEAIESAMITAIDMFNIIPPPTSYNYTIESFPSRGLLLLGTTAMLLKGAAIYEAVNELSYSAAGVSIDDHNKAQIYTALGKELWDEFKELAQQVKVSQNAAQCYGTKNSEYRYRGWH